MSFSTVEDVEHEAELVVLLVGALAGLVLMLIVGIELEVLADGEITSGVKSGVGPLAVLALVEELTADIGLQMVGVDSGVAFQLQAIPVTPGNAAILPIEVAAVAIR